jgi:hypothetical protein
MSEPKLHALLVADIGSVMTHVWLVDAVDGETRLIGQSEAPGGLSPAEDPASAILEAARRIEEQTGRRLIDNGTLVTPKNAEGQGVDGVVVCSSAAGLMGLVIAAIAGDISARSARRAARATYTHVLQTITLDDAVRQDQIGVIGDSGLTWIERQVQSLLGVRPDAVLIVGGIEGGAQEALVRLAHIIGLASLNIQVDAQGQQMRNVARRPVLFAGNSQAHDRVATALAERADLIITDNIRPTLDVECLEPVRREIVRLYDRLMMSRLARISALTRVPARASCDAAGVMTRFIAGADPEQRSRSGCRWNEHNCAPV